jgi:putative PIN family toxin of toxin-antitoxin system
MPSKNEYITQPRVIIDTNLLISAIIVPQSPPDKLLKAWQKELFILLICQEQLEEIKDVSQREKLKKYPLFSKKINELLKNLGFVAELVEEVSPNDLPIHSRDPDDDFLLAFALQGKADYLITGDEDLLILNGESALGKLKIVKVTDFLNMLHTT